MFETRTGHGPTFLSRLVPGRKIKGFVSDGDEVTLKIGEEDVLVREVVLQSSGKFAGTILGFEPSYKEEFKGLVIGQRVEFIEANVFGCTER